ncbi:MAG: glycosyltransferase [Opitutaceae bacterium]
MSSAPLKLLHIAPHARGFGGIETLLMRHAAADAAAGFDASQIALFNRGAAAEARFRPMRFGWCNSPRAMRDEMRRALMPHAGSIVIWHSAWGLPWFAEFDAAARRVVCLHEHRGAFEMWLPAIRDDLDGILAVSPAIARDAAEVLPGWPAERIGCLPLPIAVPTDIPLDRSARDIWIIGCAGRLARQKRWERLVPCVAELRRLGVRFRVEIIGDGPMRPWLEQQFYGDAAVTFLGFVDTVEYWRRMCSWDAALFFSDVEGGPIALLEAMAAGVLPVYPSIGGSVGDDYAPQIDPRCYYPAGDPVAAARGLQALLAASSAELEEKRGVARALTKPHAGGAYEVQFREVVRRIIALPRLSSVSLRRRRSWMDGLPLGVITRVFPQHLWR